MTAPNSGQPVRRGELGVVEEFTTHGYERLAKIFEDFHDPTQEWRRLFSRVFGTFLLVLVAAGGGMMGQAFPNTISRTAAVTAPGIMVMGIILFMGTVSGAHLNPAVTLAFAIRGNFPWLRVPGYLIAQAFGAILAALFLQLTYGHILDGATEPAPQVNFWVATLTEAMLTLGLVSVILGTASGARNIGANGALAIGGYIGLVAVWAAPVTGASMNPVRSLAPMLVAGDLRHYWIYLLGPILGAVIAVGFAFVLRGSGGLIGLGGRPGRPLHRGRAA